MTQLANASVVTSRSLTLKRTAGSHLYMWLSLSTHRKALETKKTKSVINDDNRLFTGNNNNKKGLMISKAQ